MITTERADDVLVVTLDRPEQRNALTPSGLDALEAAVTGTDAPVVYLQGAGDAFCAGADLDVVAALDNPRGFAAHGQVVAQAIEKSESIVVAGVDGAARGGGVELALACDLRVGTTEATFAETGVELGLFGAWGGTARLPRVVGDGEAMDIALSGRVVDAEAALRMGLLSRVTADPRSVATEVAANDHGALAVLKRRLRDDDGRVEQERREADAFATLHAAAEFDRG
jgi:enoyl-CoA hydratase/carnithine racemase